MKAAKIWKFVPAVLMCCTVGLAVAKLPAPTEEAKAKAAEAKAKSDVAAKKSAEDLSKAQDRVADRYKKAAAKK